MSRDTARVDRDPEVRQIAKTLGVAGPNLRAKLTAFAVAKVKHHLDRFGIEPATLTDVHEAVLDLTRVTVKRVETDVELHRLSCELKEKLPVQLEFEFERNTEALVIRDAGADPRCASFTAIVDARGDRVHRAWFAERHEPAHILLPDPSGRAAWRRTTTERPEPLEQVIDAVAAELGFWEPIVRPALDLALRQESSVLEAFGSTRRILAPEASVEASYRAFTRLISVPLTVLRVDFACRRADRRNAERSLALRAVTTLRNIEAERHGIVVWPNFRIPDHSVLHQSRSAFIPETLVQEDDLRAWLTEEGQPLTRTSRPVRVTARGAWATIEVAR